MKPIEQKEIDFQGRKIIAVMVQDENGRENVYVPLKPLVEGMGLNWRSQSNRIRRNPVLSEACCSVVVTTTEPNRTRRINMLCIPISKLNGFLFGINAKRVKPEIRPFILEYQAKCYEVLFEAFNGTDSMHRFYSSIGHDPKWIGARIEKHNKATELSDIWLVSGVPIEHHERLQSIMNKGTFGLTVEEHKQLKNLPEGEKLRDNMTTMELVFSMIGDEAAIILSGNEDPTGLTENTIIATVAGEMAAEHIELFEKRTGAKVLSDKNHLDKNRPQLGDG